MSVSSTSSTFLPHPQGNGPTDTRFSSPLQEPPAPVTRNPSHLLPKDPLPPKPIPTYTHRNRPPQTSEPMASAHGSLPHLLPPTYKRLVTSWLEEDCPTFDHGGFVVGDTPSTATLWCKSPGMLAGVPFVDEVFHQLGCIVEWRVREGATLDPSSSAGEGGRIRCATVTGPARMILLGERVALNVLARCSGIATVSARVLRLVRATGWPGVLAGTRKTTPGFRVPEKYAMVVGGVDAHRMDLSAMTMLKDNHVAACGGSIADAVAAARAGGGFAVKIEVECRSEEEAEEAVRAGADVVMLDNFGGDGVRRVSRGLKERWRGRREFLIEVSGGVTEGNLRDGFLAEHVDVVSTSSVHQGVGHVDFSLKIVEGPAKVEEMEQK